MCALTEPLLFMQILSLIASTAPKAQLFNSNLNFQLAKFGLAEIKGFTMNHSFLDL
jgi:hypothetical protein